MLMQIMNKMRFFIFIFLFFSCEFQKKTNSTGKSLEVILIQGQDCTDSAFDIFRKNFISPQLPLLEAEIYGEQKSFFRVIPILEKDFSSIFRTHKNIIFVNLADDFSMQIRKDLWAKNQNIYACSIDKNQLNNNNKIVSFAYNSAKKIKNNEIIKRATYYNKSTPVVIKKFLKDKYNLSISLPNRFFITDSLNTNLNLRGDTRKSSQRLLVSSFNLEPTVDNIISEQNRLAKKNISGDIEGSYVTIEERIQVYIDTLINTNHEKINIKGIWKMQGDFMGGSFFTTLIVNPRNKKKTLISSYLYAPGENKANYLLDLEAILKSTRYINN